MQASIKLGQAMYEAQQSEDGDESTYSSSEDAEVVDADFEEVDDKDKN